MDTQALNVYEINHPFVAHHLTLMRSEDCTHNVYRRCIRQSYRFLAYEALTVLPPPTSTTKVRTDLGEILGGQLQIDSEKMAIVAILRGGIVASETVHELLPRAPIAHFATDGSKAALPKIKYEEGQERLVGRQCLVLATRIETGSTLISVLARMKSLGVDLNRSIIISLVCAPEGVGKIYERYPEIPIVTAKLDDRLDELDRVVPGIGQIGTRLYETKEL